MKQIRWIKRGAACLSLGAVLTGAFCGPAGMAFGAQGSTYDRIVNAQSGLTSTVVNERHYSTYEADDEEESSRRTYREEDITTGPGAASKVEIVEDQETEGPQVEDVSLSERHHEDFGVYEEDMGNRYFLYATVENGGITDQPVSVDIPAGLTFVMEKDGEALEYEAGMTFDEAGSYMIYPSQGTTVYLGEYGTDKRPMFHFRIVSGPIRDMGIYNAPQGYEIGRITLDGEAVTEGLDESGSWCYLAEDGEYEILLSHEEDMTSDLNVTIVRDSTQPRFLVSVEDSTAYFQYQSDDIAYCRLYRGDELVSDGQIPAMVSGSGTYRLEAYDEAGNMAYSEFEIDFHFNTGAIVVIVLVIALIVGLVVFLRRTRRQIKVR